MREKSLIKKRAILPDGFLYYKMTKLSDKSGNISYNLIQYELPYMLSHGVDGLFSKLQGSIDLNFHPQSQLNSVPLSIFSSFVERIFIFEHYITYL